MHGNENALCVARVANDKYLESLMDIKVNPKQHRTPNATIRCNRIDKHFGLYKRKQIQSNHRMLAMIRSSTLIRKRSVPPSFARTVRSFYNLELLLRRVLMPLFIIGKSCEFFHGGTGEDCGSFSATIFILSWRWIISPSHAVLYLSGNPYRKCIDDREANRT